MEKQLKKWLKECKITKSLLSAKRLKFLTKDYERIIIDTQLKDINIIIDKINFILKNYKEGD